MGRETRSSASHNSRPSHTMQLVVAALFLLALALPGALAFGCGDYSDCATCQQHSWVGVPCTWIANTNTCCSWTCRNNSPGPCSSLPPCGACTTQIGAIVYSCADCNINVNNNNCVCGDGSLCVACSP